MPWIDCSASSTSPVQGAADSAGGTVEDGKRAVPGKIHDPPAVARHDLACLELVLGKPIAPGPITKLSRETGRIDNVGQQQRGEDSFAKSGDRREPRFAARPGERLERLVTNDPRVMAGRYVHDVEGANVELDAIIEQHVEPAR
jgi:hypothetical protein